MSAHSRILYSLGVLVLGLVLLEAEYVQDKKDKLTYRGLIREDAQPGDEVELDRPLMVRNRGQLLDPEICGYTLYKSYSELPFKVELLDRKDGSARIKLASGYTLDYERRYRYSFDIAAHDCTTGLHTDREKVYIEVEDVNEFLPHWAEEMYIAEVEEGRYFDQILHLEAIDEDGSDKFSLICDYHIDTNNVPFEVDAQGYLRNTAPLDYSQRHNYILEVRAVDCGGLMSEKTMVNIAVKESCKVGWKNIPESVQFIPGSGAQLVADQASLDLCGMTCDNPKTSVTIELEGTQQVQVCDKDTYSIQAQRRMCGAAPETVDLLPNPTMGSWDKTPKGHQNSDQTFSFDGKDAIEVEETKVDGHLGDSFSISTWMSHKGSEADEKHAGLKQHILCYSDGEYHNRHHYSVFVHNCHLVMLLRHEPGAGVDLNQFTPAEWRWEVPQVCDGDWHHYSINVEFPEVHLYIDGHRTLENEDNPVIVDDWPLHPSKKVTSMKLVVGACWHGGDKEMAQHFQGQLAGLTLLKDQSESDTVIQCLSDCQEKIDFHDMTDLETGMSVSLNSEMTHITFNGHNKSYIERLVQHVGYKNARVYPTPGEKKVLMTTHIECEGVQSVEIPDVEMTVSVTQPERPTMRLSGSDQVSYTEDVIARGVSILKDLTISSNVKEKDEIKNDKIQSTLEDPATLRYQLDSCVVRADPILDISNEHMTYPRNLVTTLGLEISSSEEGIIIAGADIVKHYQEVLRAIHYIHSAPHILNTRHFVVSCTELNGRFVSNDFEVQLDVIHKQPKPKNKIMPAHRQADIVYQQVADVRIKDAPDKEVKSLNGLGAGTGAAAGTGVGMIVIIVVCVGFLMFMIVLGVMRIRSAQQRREVTVEDRPEMEWDNSALTITVNPMDQDTAYDEEPEDSLGGMAAGGDSDTDDDEISITHDDAESSEDEGPQDVKVVKDGLEWDDSTLSF